MRDIYINSNLNSLSKFTGSSSSRNIKFKDILPKVIHEGKGSVTLTEVKPVHNTNKNQQRFLEINPVPKKVLPSNKLQDHAYD